MLRVKIVGRLLGGSPCNRDWTIGLVRLANTLTVNAMPVISSRASGRPTGFASLVAESFETLAPVWSRAEYVNLAHGRPFLGPHHVVNDALRNLSASIAYETDASVAPVDSVVLNNYRWTRTTCTLPELTRAAWRDFRRTGLPVAELEPDQEFSDEIVAGNGVTQLYWAALWATVDSGRAILTPSPTYGPFVPITEMLGVRFATIPSRKPRPEELAAALTDNPDTGCILLINPSNPCGDVYTRADYQGYLEVLRPHPDIWIIEDASYDRVFLDRTAAEDYTMFGALELDGVPTYERTVTLKGLAKAHGLTQLRVGIACGPSAAIERMHTFITMNTVAPDELAQHVAAAALDGSPRDYFERAGATYRQHAEVVAKHACSLNQRLNAHLGTSGKLHVQAETPEAGFFMIYRIPALLGCRTFDGIPLMNDTSLFHLLLEKCLLVLPASAAGMDPRDMGLRLTLASPLTDIVAGLQIIEEVVLAGLGIPRS